MTAARERYWQQGIAVLLLTVVLGPLVTLLLFNAGLMLFRVIVAHRSASLDELVFSFAVLSFAYTYGLIPTGLTGVFWCALTVRRGFFSFISAFKALFIVIFFCIIIILYIFTLNSSSNSPPIVVALFLIGVPALLLTPFVALVFQLLFRRLKLIDPNRLQSGAGHD
ncbi:MAG: hypothetical protein AAFX39_02575 [Pseudomonadota bacterium]